jgi:MoxR-like ATPase
MTTRPTDAAAQPNADSSADPSADSRGRPGAAAPSEADVRAIAAEVERVAPPIQKLVDAIESVVVGQRPMVEGLLTGLLTGGHVLLEGVPGLAKTLTVSSMAAAIDATFKRIQFTPDLLPADVVGTLIYNPKEGTFTPRRGPVFANIVLADEINRAPAKVQSALLEAMQERQVTIGDETYALPRPFLVLATQNPIEQEGTYPLPEAQVDRFLLKLRVGYPSRAEERRMLDRMATSAPKLDVERVLSVEHLAEARGVCDTIYVDEKIKEYIIDVVRATREPEAVGGGGRTGAGGASREMTEIRRLIDFGASPRATIALTLASRARALLAGRGYVTPQDVKSAAPDVLRHRVLVSYEAEAEGRSSDDVVKTILDHVPVP